MRFSETFLEQIKARVQVSTVVGRVVQWDRRKTNAGRGDYWACCPFHHEKTPSFHADDRKGRYYCFGCKASGDIFRFLTEKQGMSFYEAVEQLAGEAGLELPVQSKADIERDKKRASLYDVMEFAAQFFEQALQTPDGAAARGYLADRGLGGAVQQKFRIGFAPASRHALKQHLVEKEISQEQMAEAGLLIAGPDIAVSYDRFRDRIMFPIRDTRGRVIAFGGRTMNADVPAKYLNSPETVLFHKSDVLYNLDQARQPAYERGMLVAVEGYMDVIAMDRAGIAGAVAPLGTALTASQLQMMWRIVPEPVLCFDGDSAGAAAAWRALETALPLLRAGHSLRFAVLPEGQDPDDVLTGDGAQALEKIIADAAAMIDVLWRHMLEGNDRSTPERRAKFEADVDSLAGLIGDSGVREHYRAELRARMKDLWRGGKAGWRQRARPGRAAFRPGRKGAGRKAFNQRPWEQHLPASRELMAQSSKASLSHITERRERLILLAVINHPGILDACGEEFSELEFSSPGLDRMRREIIDIAAQNIGLDSAAMKDHLNERGLDDVLERIVAQARRLDSWFIEADAAGKDAMTGFLHMIALHRKTVTLERALKQAERELAVNPTEENFSHLNEIREQLRSSSGEEAIIEGFGDASGRPATGGIG